MTIHGRDEYVGNGAADFRSPRERLERYGYYKPYPVYRNRRREIQGKRS